MHIQVIGGGGYYKVGNGVDLWKDLPYPIDNHTHKIENVNGLEYELNARTEYSTTRSFDAGDESTHTYKIIRIKCNNFYCSFDFEFSLISRDARLNNKYRLSFAMDGNHNLSVDSIIFEHYTENSNNVHAYAIQDADGSYYIDIYAEVYTWDMVFLYKDREMNMGGSEITTPLERDVQEPETYLKKVYPSPITYPKAKHDQNGNVINETYALLSHTHAISDVTGLQTALDGKPKYETGTWTPVISDPGPLSFQPYTNPKYTKIGKLCILTVNLYLLFDSEAYPVSEDDKVTYPNYEYVDKTTVSRLESMGITFTTEELSTGAFMPRTLFLNPDRFPFSIDKLIGGTAHNLGTPYSSGDIIEGYNYNNGHPFISVRTKVYCCNKPVYFSGRYAPPYYTTLCIMYLTSR